MTVRWIKFKNPNFGYGCDGEVGQYMYDCGIFVEGKNWKWYVDIEDDAMVYASVGTVRGTTPEGLQKAKIQVMNSCRKLLAKAQARSHREYVRKSNNNRKLANLFKSA